MKKQTRKDIQAVIFAVVFGTLGFLIVVALKCWMNITDAGIIIALMLTPLILFSLVSGRLAEFSGPGGLGAKFFREVATETIHLPSELVPINTVLIAKGDPQELQRRMGTINDASPIAMTMNLGRESYDTPEVSNALYALSQFRNFKFVIFLDEADKLIGYMPHWVLETSLRNTQTMKAAEQLIEDVKEGHKEAVLKYPGVLGKTATLKTSDSNIEALSKMERQNLEALVIVDKDNKVKGIVERDRILARMMIALAEEAETS